MRRPLWKLGAALGPRAGQGGEQLPGSALWASLHHPAQLCGKTPGTVSSLLGRAQGQQGSPAHSKVPDSSPSCSGGGTATFCPRAGLDSFPKWVSCLQTCPNIFLAKSSTSDVSFTTVRLQNSHSFSHVSRHRTRALHHVRTNSTVVLMRAERDGAYQHCTVTSQGNTSL